MALKKQLRGPRGEITSYHRIAVISAVYLPEQSGIQINLASYADEAYRDVEKADGKDMALTNTPIVLPFEDVENLSRERLYERIKAEIELFNDAENC